MGQAKAKYKTEKRKANVGERILITHTTEHSSMRDLKVGSVYEAIKSYDGGFFVGVIDDACERTPVRHDYYEVVAEETIVPFLTTIEVLASATSKAALVKPPVPDNVEQPAPDLTETERLIVGLCESLSDTLIRKDRDYGESFAKQYDKRGMLSALIRMEDKMSRLESLVDGCKPLVDESIDDTLLDLAGYAIRTLVERKKAQL